MNRYKAVGLLLYLISALVVCAIVTFVFRLIFISDL